MEQFNCVSINNNNNNQPTTDTANELLNQVNNNIDDEFSLNSETSEKIQRSSSSSKAEQTLTTTKTTLTSDKSNKLSDLYHEKATMNKADGEMKNKQACNEKQRNIKNKSSTLRQQQKQQFRIDWRQLTYYQKPDSYLSSFINKLTTTNKNKNHHEAGTNYAAATDNQSLHYPDHLTNSTSETQTLNSFDNHDLMGSAYQANKPKRILNSLDGCFRSGELSAILGPSGAGKSTFLATLFGKKQDGAYGQTRVTWFNENEDGQLIAETTHQKNHLQNKQQKRSSIKIASLPQHDHLLHHLTVYETLMFASKLKNSTLVRSGDSSQQFKKNKNFHRQNVRRVAKMLKITECLDTRCGKLSGGQYKRVSIGQELLSEPDVIILDEPTSGLDAMTCLTTIQTLKSIVMKHPMSIILTIHQPDIDVFTLFDHVYVIAQGGLAIYEGPPEGIIPTLKAANLKIPSSNYNPARLIVEHAFVVEPDSMNGGDGRKNNANAISDQGQGYDDDDDEDNGNNRDDDDEDDEDYDDEEDEDLVVDTDSGINKLSQVKMSNYIKRSVLSLTEAISGKELSSGGGGGGATNGKNKNKDKTPLLNIGIQTLDGKLITSEKLQLNKQNQLKRKQSERINLLKKLNQIQKSKYSTNQQDLFSHRHYSSSLSSGGAAVSALTSAYHGDESIIGYPNQHQRHLHQQHISFNAGREKLSLGHHDHLEAIDAQDRDDKCSAKSDYSSSGCSSDQHQSKSGQILTTNNNNNTKLSSSLANITGENNSSQSNGNPCFDENYSGSKKWSLGRSLQFVNNVVELDPRSQNDHSNTTARSNNSSSSDHESVISENDEFVVNFGDTTAAASSFNRDCAIDIRGNSNSKQQNNDCGRLVASPTSFYTTTSSSTSSSAPNNHKKYGRGSSSGNNNTTKLRRQFDKRLSAKHNCSKQTNYPIWYHAFLLTHRTWLSIVRDPIFFGIQAIMHTTIPILLGLIFGSTQEEGCPRIGNFDLVDFAYSDSDNLIQGTVRSIRQSIGNIGIMFFEMFVLSFSINCITALVFPADMHVLLKEYRNGWYSLRSYFFGRTLADLPVPIFLHSLGIAILYYITGQPQSLARFTAIVAIVILGSLVAQSLGLTVGALLMKSSQSAVLTAAGIVAPFFALSGFIVRIHTLPLVAQIAAKCSYLYYLLNGFIILRYGFGRCQCSAEDFETDSSHQIPSNLHTLASMWIGTYSNEYTESPMMTTTPTTTTTTSFGSPNSNSHIPPPPSIASVNRTNVDPNIDIVDKMMNTFKMANSYGHHIQNCDDVLPYAMLDFNLRDQDIYVCFAMLVIMVVISRFITFTAIYYKIRSVA